MKIIFPFCRRSSMKIFRQKTAKNHVILGLIFALFFAINFHFCSQREPKNDFHVKSILETCSETSIFGRMKFYKWTKVKLNLLQISTVFLQIFLQLLRKRLEISHTIALKKFWWVHYTSFDATSLLLCYLWQQFDLSINVTCQLHFSTRNRDQPEKSVSGIVSRL